MTSGSLTVSPRGKIVECIFRLRRGGRACRPERAFAPCAAQKGSPIARMAGLEQNRSRACTLSAHRRRPAPGSSQRPWRSRPRLTPSSGSASPTSSATTRRRTRPDHRPGLVNAWGLSYRPAVSPFWVSANGNGTANIYSVDPNTQGTIKAGLTVDGPGRRRHRAGLQQCRRRRLQRRHLPLRRRGRHDRRLAQRARHDRRDPQAGVAQRCLQGRRVRERWRATVTCMPPTFAAARSTSSRATPARPNSPATSPTRTCRAVTRRSTSRTSAARCTSLMRCRTRTSTTSSPAPGRGFVASFDLQGNLLGRIASARHARRALGSGDRAVVVRRARGRAAGRQLRRRPDQRLRCDDPRLPRPARRAATARRSRSTACWALAPGNDSNSGGRSSLLYFTAGPDDESHGVFGVLSPQAVPESSSAILLLSGMAAIAAFMRRRGASRQR